MIINYSIKIDHHPKIEEFCDLELIDDKKSSSFYIIESNFKLRNFIKKKAQIVRKWAFFMV